MADQVDSMSDAELRTKLAEHGFPVMPITASTRKLLVKKLKMVLNNKSKPRNRVDSKVEGRRSLARYSSGEESDIDTNSVKDKRGRRATTGASMLPPVTKTRPTPDIKDSPMEVDFDMDSDEEDRQYDEPDEGRTRSSEMGGTHRQSFCERFTVAISHN